MNLKEFITETISAIADSVSDLQKKYEPAGIVINPPVMLQERDLYRSDDSQHTYRRVEVVEFDVAVSAETQTGGGGKAGLRVMTVELGVDGTHARKAGEVSRVKFTLPIVLGATEAEGANRTALEAEERRNADAMSRVQRHVP